MSFFRAPQIPTHYDERKATAAAAFFIQADNARRIKFIRLIKLLYAADREAWSRYGRPITGDSYVAMEHGPVLSETYDLIKKEGEQPEPSGPWQKAIRRVNSYDVSLAGDADLGPLSRAEIDILRDVHERYKNVGTWGPGGIIELLHALPEWKQHEPRPGKQTPYGPEDVLKAIGKGDQIKAIRDDMAALEEFQRLLTAP